jgi:hypothetical protein
MKNGRPAARIMGWKAGLSRPWRVSVELWRSCAIEHFHPWAAAISTKNGDGIRLAGHALGVADSGMSVADVAKKRAAHSTLPDGIEGRTFSRLNRRFLSRKPGRTAAEMQLNRVPLSGLLAGSALVALPARSPQKAAEPGTENDEGDDKRMVHFRPNAFLWRVEKFSGSLGGNF